MSDIEYKVEGLLNELAEIVEELRTKVQSEKSELKIVYDIVRKMLIEAVYAVEGARILHNVEGINMLYEARRLTFIAYGVLSKYKHDEKELLDRIERVWSDLYDLYYKHKRELLTKCFK